MTKNDIYTTLKREPISLADFDAEEQSVVSELMKLQEQAATWPEYANAYMPKVSALYLKRGLSRRDITKTAVWKIAQDLSSRILVRLGHARAPDYRDDLDTLIRAEFPSRRAFCEATGISEDMLSHVLAHRKHLAIDTLSDALSRIGYRLHIVPASESKS